MKYVARIVLMLSIVAVSLVAFTFAAPTEAGNGGDHFAFHCQGPDVYGYADIAFSPNSSLLETLFCTSDGVRVVNNDPPPNTSYYVTLSVYVLGSGFPDKICTGWMTVPGHFPCGSDFGPQTVTLHLR